MSRFSQLTMSRRHRDVLVADYGTPQLAADAAARKRLVFPASQTYTGSNLKLKPGCYVAGNNSTLKFADNTMTSAPGDDLMEILSSGVTIDGLNFDGNSQNQTGTWSEQKHCMRIRGGCYNVTVKNCDFINIIGDGVYVNTGVSTGGNIKVGPNNTFTANNDNRNGVSLITGDTIEVFNNTFTTVSRSDMPGPIDIEPNSSSEYIAHVDIHDNTIVGSATPLAPAPLICGIAAAMNQNATADDIKIRNNDISGVGFWCGIMIRTGSASGFSPATGIVVDSNNIHGINTVSGTVGIYLLEGINSDVTNNTLNGMVNGIYSWESCLGASTGNTYIGVTNNLTEVNRTCS